MQTQSDNDNRDRLPDYVEYIDIYGDLMRYIDEVYEEELTAGINIILYYDE